MKVWAAAPGVPDTQESRRSGQPGEILDVEKRGVLVACGVDNLWVQSIQIPLGKGSILSGADILNSRRALFACGTVLR
jgi:methionyl-tRNA formyltransferase